MALNERGQVELSTKTYPLTGALDAFSDLDNGRLPGTRAILVP
jgi:NAD+-dependent secondary alcohol dehydrogenase Adh1